MQFNLSPDDFLRGKIVKPGWHHAEIVGYEEKMSKAKVNERGESVPPSAYVELKFKILDGEDAGVVVYNNFSEKAPGFIVPFLEALMGGDKKMERKAQTVTFSKDKILGQFVDIEVVRGTYNNKPTNNINGFKPFTGQKPTAPAQK